MPAAAFRGCRLFHSMPLCHTEDAMETFTDCKKLQISYNDCTEVAK